MKILKTNEFIKLNENFTIDNNCKYTAIYTKSSYHSQVLEFMGLESDTFEDAIIELKDNIKGLSGHGHIYIVLTNTIQILYYVFGYPQKWKADCVGHIECKFISSSSGFGGWFKLDDIDDIKNWETNLGEITRER